MGDCVSKEIQKDDTIHSFVVCVRDDEETSIEDASDALYEIKSYELAISIAPGIKLNANNDYNPMLAIQQADQSITDYQLELHASDSNTQVSQFSTDEQNKINSFIKDQSNTVYHNSIVGSEAELKVKIDDLIIESNLDQNDIDSLISMPYSDLDDRFFSAHMSLKKKVGDHGVGFHLSLKQHINKNHDSALINNPSSENQLPMSGQTHLDNITETDHAEA